MTIGSKNKIWLFITETEDWSNYSYHKLQQRLKDTTLYLPQLNGKIKLMRQWDHQFRLSYFRYRQEIKKIAEKNWVNLNVIERSFEKLLEVVGDEDWVIRSDDDDWLHPNVDQFLDTNFDFLHWDSWVYNVWKGSISRYNNVGYGKLHNCPCSNGYAIKGKQVKKLPKKNIQVLLSNHTLAKQIAHRFKLRTHFIEEILSCYNKHPGSLSSERFGSRAHCKKPSFNEWPKPYALQLWQLINKENTEIKLL